MATYQELFASTTLMQMVEKIKTGIPPVIPDAFMRVTGAVRRDLVEWAAIQGTRATPQLSGYNAPAQRKTGSVYEKHSATCLHMKTSFVHSVNDLLGNTLNPATNDVDAIGESKITNELRQMLAECTNMRHTAVGSLLALGHIYADVEGNMLPSASGAIYDVNAGIGANNLNQINGIIAVDWDIVTAPIIEDIGAIKRAALQTTGYPLVHAFYGSDIPTWIAINDYAKEYLYRNAAMNDAYMTSGAIPPGFAGMQWHDMSSLFFVDQDGTVQTVWPTDVITFTPEPNPSWYGFIEGSYAIPTSLAMATDMLALLNNTRIVQGQFSFAQATAEGGVLRVEQFVGDTIMPTLLNPDAVFIADVKAT